VSSAAPPPDPSLTERAGRIRVLVTDVDGVWTDGTLYHYPGEGDGDQGFVELKSSSAYDGQGLRWWHDAGHVSGIISGRDSAGITYRAQMLGMSHIYQGHLEKTGCWEEILAATKATDDDVAYIGDDLPDVPLLRRAGLAVAVANGRDEVKSVAHYVTQQRGGQGAVREVIELILKARGEWDAVLRKYGLTT
jgi:3-deoxy-D-manno-octulosonate 8-phosphate phosphatase (KDO 8-P phosphatase)